MFPVIDSGSNFLKVFRLFSMLEADNYFVEPVPANVMRRMKRLKMMPDMRKLMTCLQLYQQVLLKMT